MPELPEVETVARLVRPRLVGRTVTGAAASWRRSVGGLAPRELEKRLVGKRITAVRRRAKFVVIDLERDGAPAGHLVCHLRMSGRLHVERGGVDLGSHVRARVALDDGNELVFVDVRKFGRLLAVDDLEPLLGALGPEPLAPEFDAARLRAALGSRRRALKPLLLDQTFLAGLGNIYVDEALFRSRLHPLRRSDRVPPAAALRLCAEIRAVLSEAILREGSSFDTFYRTPEGRPGSYQEQFRVYGRHGKPCRDCGATIRRIVVGQRGTHVCPRCQRTPLTAQPTREHR